MEELDVFFAQNWIEQFRYNIFVHPYHADIFSVTRAFARYETGREVIHNSFEWADTPQHPDRHFKGVWFRREYKVAIRGRIIR